MFKKASGLLIICGFIMGFSATAFAEEMNDSDILDLMNKMTLEEKVTLVHAASIFENGSVPRLGIPPIVMSDGPHGVRWETGNFFMYEDHPHNAITYLPTLTALAACWNPQLAYRSGEVLGTESRSRGKTMILGPGVNILRTPLNGRNFEYMGEDPYLASILALENIKGIQSVGTAACIKHFALNNQEKLRTSINVEADERALREIYLPAFKRAVLEGNVLSIMPAFNRFRGEFCAENSYLLNKILRDEWGFLGVAVSDWGAVHSTDSAAAMSLDIEMGTLYEVDSWKNFYLANNYLKGLKNGDYPIEDLNRKVYHIIYLLQQTNRLGETKATESSDKFINLPEHQQTTLDIARESIVLLRNQKNILPLPKKDLSILVVGEVADRENSENGGSSNIMAFYEKTILQGMKAAVSDYENVSIDFIPGYQGQAGIASSSRAVRKASKADYVLFCGGLSHSWHQEQENSDRLRYDLPWNQLSLVKRLIAANPNTIVTITAGTPVGFGTVEQNISTLLYNWYNGMDGGTALAEVLFGEVNPSGRLPFTIAKKLSDYPAHQSKNRYPGVKGQVDYSESIYNGYRYFETSKVKTLFPFGLGLSYTSFNYENLSVILPKTVGETVKVAFDITNNGDRSGKTVAQIYISDTQSEMDRPVKELKGFVKVELKPGQTVSQIIELNRDAFSWFHPDKGWITEPGEFIISVSENAASDILTASVKIEQFEFIRKGIN